VKFFTYADTWKPETRRRSTEALAENGVRATFDRPETRFHVEITLDNGAVLNLDDQGRVPPPLTGPYQIYSVKADTTLRRSH
jgi:hypothetical protein